MGEDTTGRKGRNREWLEEKPMEQSQNYSINSGRMAIIVIPQTAVSPRWPAYSLYFSNGVNTQTMTYFSSASSISARYKCGQVTCGCALCNLLNISKRQLQRLHGAELLQMLNRNKYQLSDKIHTGEEKKIGQVQMILHRLTNRHILSLVFSLTHTHTHAPIP